VSTQKVISVETVIHQLPDVIRTDAEDALNNHLETSHQTTTCELLFMSFKNGLTANGIEIGAFRVPLAQVCKALNVAAPPNSEKLSYLLQAAIIADKRLSQIHLASVESDWHRKIIVVDKDVVPSETSIVEPFVTKSGERTFAASADDRIDRGPPNSWEYIPKIIEIAALHSFDSPYQPDFGLNQLADDLSELRDVRNLTLLIETLENPRIELSERHVFKLVRAASAVNRPDYVERAYALLPESDNVSPFLLSAVLSARSLGGHLTEALEEFEKFVRQANPLEHINNRVCGQALNIATRIGLHDRALDILGFMKMHNLQISAIDLSVVVKNQTDSTVMLDLLTEFLPITETVDNQIFLPVLKCVWREFQRIHQYAVRSGTIVSGREQLRKNVDNCLNLMSQFNCGLNSYTYPLVIRLYCDLDDPIKANSLFQNCITSGELEDEGIIEILNGVYHASVRSFLLDVGRYGKTNRRLSLPVHDLLENIQRLTFQGAFLRPLTNPPSRAGYQAAMWAFSDQLDLLDALLVLVPEFAPTTLVRKLSLLCQRDHQSGTSVLAEIMSRTDLGEKLDSDEWQRVSKSVAKMASFPLMERWIEKLEQTGRLSPAHFIEVINSAVAEVKQQKYSLSERSRLLEKCEEIMSRTSLRFTGDPITNADWRQVLVHLARTYSAIGDRESVLRLERDMQELGMDSEEIGLGLLSDILLDSHVIKPKDSYIDSSWSDVTILLEDVVHELNQPLLGATNALKVLRKRILSGASADQLIEPLGRMQRHVQRVSERIAEYAHSVQASESNTMSADIEPQLLKVLSKFESTISSLGVRVSKRGSQGGSPPVPMNSVLLRIILNNSIRNSLEAFEEAKTKNPEILIAYGKEPSARSAQKRYYLTIQDNGPGIPQKILETVWLKGVTTKNERGLGLGLPLIRTVINRLGGDIRIISPLPNGASGTKLVMRL
jgi:signal transduction histidine kinase